MGKCGKNIFSRALMEEKVMIKVNGCSLYDLCHCSLKVRLFLICNIAAINLVDVLKLFKIQFIYSANSINTHHLPILDWFLNSSRFSTLGLII